MRAVPRVSRATLRSGFLAPCPHASPPSRTHANGSIKRGCKDNATDPVPLRTGIGVQLKDIKVFNRDRQKGEAGRRAGQGGEVNKGSLAWEEEGTGEKAEPSRNVPGTHTSRGRGGKTEQQNRSGYWVRYLG